MSIPPPVKTGGFQPLLTKRWMVVPRGIPQVPASQAGLIAPHLHRPARGAPALVYSSRRWCPRSRCDRKPGSETLPGSCDCPGEHGHIPNRSGWCGAPASSPPSSRKLKQHHPELVQPAYLKNSLWSPSYFAGSVGGAPIEVLRQYIEKQKPPH
jgi:putative transposase